MSWAAVIAGGASIASGALGYFGAGDAADEESDAAKKSLKFQKKMYKHARRDTAPWREAGANALTNLTDQIAAGPGEFEESPGYQFTLDQGLKAQRNALSAMGQNRSGKRLKSAAQYAEGLASTEYDNFLNRWYQSQEPLFRLSGMGQTSAGQSANLAYNTGQGGAQSIETGGQAQGSGAINQTNALSGALQTGANALLKFNAGRNLQQPQQTAQYPNVPTIRGGQGGGYGF